jgi:hypothetical protein
VAAGLHIQSSPFGIWRLGIWKTLGPISAALSGRIAFDIVTQGFYEPTFVKSVNLGVISGGLRREETKRTRS